MNFRDFKNTGNSGIMPQTINSIITSVSADGKSANVETYKNSEARSNKIMLPYGVASSPMRGMQAQLLLNDSNNNSVVGVYDSSRPAVKVGECMLYTAAGQKIYLKNDGSISITTSGGASITMHDGNIDINGTVKINGNTV